MKALIITAIVLLPSLGFCQDCDSILIKEKDKFTDKKELGTEMVEIANADQKILWRISLHEKSGYEKQRANFSLVVFEESVSGCIDDGAKIIFLFSDNSKITRTNTFSFNCKGIAGIPFYMKGMGGHAKELEKFSTLRLQSVRISLMSTYYDYDFLPDQADDIMQAFKCAVAILND